MQQANTSFWIERSALGFEDGSAEFVAAGKVFPEGHPIVKHCPSNFDRIPDDEYMIKAAQPAPAKKGTSR